MRHISAVELPLQWSLQWQQLAKVGPAQVSPQRGDNRLVRERFGELDHAAQVLFLEATAKLGGQLSRQRGDNLNAVVRPRCPQHVNADALADAPVEHGQAHVHRDGRSASSVLDQLAQVDEKRVAGA
jgi:hypothetical protein